MRYCQSNYKITGLDILYNICNILNTKYKKTMKNFNFKLSFGEKTDEFLTKYRLFFRIIKFALVMTISFWAISDIMVLKHVEQSQKLFTLLSISWVIILKLSAAFVILYYNIPQKEKVTSKEASINSAINIAS